MDLAEEAYGSDWLRWNDVAVSRRLPGVVCAGIRTSDTGGGPCSPYALRVSRSILCLEVEYLLYPRNKPSAVSLVNFRGTAVYEQYWKKD